MHINPYTVEKLSISAFQRYNDWGLHATPE
eukprot:COSAG02_NODE_32154_length_521_cov_0.907583_1_plen_29_part_01